MKNTKLKQIEAAYDIDSLILLYLNDNFYDVYNESENFRNMRLFKDFLKRNMNTEKEKLETEINQEHEKIREEHIEEKKN